MRNSTRLFTRKIPEQVKYSVLSSSTLSQNVLRIHPLAEGAVRRTRRLRIFIFQELFFFTLHILRERKNQTGTGN